MSVKYICDGCGKEVDAVFYPGGLFKPSSWFSRRDKDGEQHACSIECVKKISKKTGKTNVILPF